MRLPFLLGRLAFGGFFLYNGINHFRNRKVMAQYAASKHVPLPEVAVEATGAALIAGGLSIMSGIAPALGSAAIVAFLGGVSPVMHDFWRQQNPHERQNQMAHFSKNMALLGAALALGFAPHREEYEDQPVLFNEPLCEESDIEQLV